MAEFLKGNKLNSKLDEILDSAEEKLYLISPFIKFHVRVKDILRRKKHNDKLHIVIVFGKNKYDREKSLSKEDFDFLASFPKVTIKYEPRLHAKYYANEKASLLSSMNLYEYSQNNNIEFGIHYAANGILENMLGKQNMDGDAWDYFRGVIENAETIYRKMPVYEKQMFGLSTKYVRSNVDIDKSAQIFGEKKTKTAPRQPFKSKQKGKLLSATALGKTVDLTYSDVVTVMRAEGLIKDDTITAKGTKQGLEYKSNTKGDSWIVYPESLKELL